MKTKNVPLRFDENDHKELKIFCAEHGFSMQEFMFKSVWKEMNRYKCEHEQAG